MLNTNEVNRYLRIVVTQLENGDTKLEDLNADDVMRLQVIMDNTPQSLKNTIERILDPISIQRARGMGMMVGTPADEGPSFVGEHDTEDVTILQHRDPDDFDD